jgi:hypothetical protein
MPYIIHDPETLEGDDKIIYAGARMEELMRLMENAEGNRLPFLLECIGMIGKEATEEQIVDVEKNTQRHLEEARQTASDYPGSVVVNDYLQKLEELAEGIQEKIKKYRDLGES